MAEELPVDLRTRRAPNPPKIAPKSPPEASLPLRKRRSLTRGFGETPPEPPNPGETPGKIPKLGLGAGTGSRAEPPPLPGPGGGSGVPPRPSPAPILGPLPPDLGVPRPLPPPLAAAIAAATGQDEDGDTPLHIAVAQGALAAARRLVALFLRGGRDLDVYNHLRQTPLHLAVITGQVALVRLLVAHGASPMAPDRLGRTCAHLACASHLPGGGAASPGGGAASPGGGAASPGGGASSQGGGASSSGGGASSSGGVAWQQRSGGGAWRGAGGVVSPPGGVACAGPRPRVLRALLRPPAPPADLQARDYEGLTPLHVAVASGSRESVLVLLEHGADVDAPDIKSGRSPLQHAVENDSLEMAELLLQRGASVNAQSYAGCTALHAAAGRGLLRLLRLLLRCGADCGLRNLHNDTAAGVAASAQVIDILRGKASRPPQEPPHGLAVEATPTSGSAANRIQWAGPPPSPAHPEGGDQSEAALGRPRPPGPQRLRPREGRGQGGDRK